MSEFWRAGYFSNYPAAVSRTKPRKINQANGGNPLEKLPDGGGFFVWLNN